MKNKTPPKKNTCGCFGRKKNRYNLSEDGIIPAGQGKQRKHPPHPVKNPTPAKQDNFGLEQLPIDVDEKRPLIEMEQKMLDAEHGDFAGGMKDEDESFEFITPVSVPSRAPHNSPSDEELVPVDKSCWGTRPQFIELTIFLYAMAYKASIPIKEQFVFAYFASINSPFTDEYTMSNNDRKLTCLVNETITTETLHHQTQSSSMYTLMVMNSLRCFPAIVSTLIICALTDKLGRRFGMLIPCLAGLISSLVQAMFVTYQVPIWCMYLTSTLEGLSGGYMTFQSCAFAYFGECLRKNRSSVRFTITLSVIYIAGALGNLISGHMIDVYGYDNAMYAVAGIYMAAIIHLWVFLPEKGAWFCTSPWIKYLPKSIQSSNLVKLRLLFFIFILECFVTLGRNNSDTLYMVSLPFCLTSTELGVYQVINNVMKMVSAFLITPSLTYMIPFPLVCCMACVSGIAGNILITLSENMVLLWIALLVGIGSSSIIPLVEHMMANLTTPKEHGALFASIGITEIFCDAFGSLIINVIFLSSVTFYGGFVFAVISGFYFTALICIMLVFSIICILDTICRAICPTLLV